tara:strand:- start:675 stop:905 length:231 start_codon:yes stop_codon:yes gene_type:complete
MPKGKYDSSIKDWKKLKENREGIVKRLKKYKASDKFYTGNIDLDKRIKDEQKKIKIMNRNISSLKKAKMKYKKFRR